MPTHWSKWQNHSARCLAMPNACKYYNYILRSDSWGGLGPLCCHFFDRRAADIPTALGSPHISSTPFPSSLTTPWVREQRHGGVLALPSGSPRKWRSWGATRSGSLLLPSARCGLSERPFLAPELDVVPQGPTVDLCVTPSVPSPIRPEVCASSGQYISREPKISFEEKEPAVPVNPEVQGQVPWLLTNLFTFSC